MVAAPEGFEARRLLQSENRSLQSENDTNTASAPAAPAQDKKPCAEGTSYYVINGRAEVQARPPRLESAPDFNIST